MRGEGGERGWGEGGERMRGEDEGRGWRETVGKEGGERVGRERRRKERVEGLHISSVATPHKQHDCLQLQYQLLLKPGKWLWWATRVMEWSWWATRVMCS